jgi:hypothetical protein
LTPLLLRTLAACADNGLDVYITNVTAQAMWQVTPMNGVETCFETDGPMAVQTLLPDMTNFTQVRGPRCCCHAACVSLSVCRVVLDSCVVVNSVAVTRASRFYFSSL